LKDNYEHQGNYPDAGDFYIGEMEMRRLNPSTNRLERFLLTLYRYLSLYGEDYRLPPLWILLWLFFGSVLMGTIGVTFGSKIINYDFLPFAIPSKKALLDSLLDFVRIFIENFKAVTLQESALSASDNVLMAIIHSLVKPTGFFLFAIRGLALRRRFRR